MMITHIFHIADLHIRAGNTEQSRFNEFKVVFDRLVKDISTHPAVKNGNAIVVVAGDVFHHKLRIESPGLKLSLDFFKNLGMLCPTYIIRGNHDFRQDKPDEPDLIQTFLHLQNIFYIDNTGTIVIDNIGFGILTVQDALQKGSTSGLSHELRKFPEPVFDDEKVTHKIGLFHGDVSKYPSNWLPRGYDLFLLGDIHVQQVVGASPCQTNHSVYRPLNSNVLSQHMYTSDNTVYGYAGSLIQQDFGENLMGHGYLLWNLEDKVVEQYHVKNDFGFVTSRLDTGKDAWDIAIKHKNNKWQPLAAVVHQPWFPKNISLRVVYESEARPSILKRAKEDFTNMDVNIMHITPMTSVSSDPFLTPQQSVTDTQLNDLVSFNNLATWVEYVSDKMSDYNNDDIDWKDWFSNPESLQTPICGNEHLSTKVEERNAKLVKKIKEYSNATNSRKLSKSNFNMSYMSWDWVLCFRSGNWFNFQDMKQHKIAVVSAKNGVGKTSLLETMCIALYGEGFPSRSSKAFSSSIICQEKPTSEKAQTSLIVDVGNDTYRIKRVFNVSNTDPTKMTAVAKETLIDRVVVNNGKTEFVNLHSGKTAVDNWIDVCIGNIRSFLMSCMISQNGDCDFFNMKSVDQKEMLDQALDIESCTLFQNILKDSKLAHHAILELTEAVMSSNSSPKSDMLLDCPLSEIEDNIRNLEEELVDKQSKHRDIIMAIPSDVEFMNFDSEYDTDDIDEKDLDRVRQELCNLLNISSYHDIKDHADLGKIPQSIPDTVPTKTREDIVSDINGIMRQGAIVASDKDVDCLDFLMGKFKGDHDAKLLETSTSEYKKLVEKYGNSCDFGTMMAEHVAEKPATPAMSKAVAAELCSGERPRKMRVDEYLTSDKITSEIQCLSKQLVDLMSQQPSKNTTVVTKPIKVLMQEVEDTCSEKDISKLQKILDKLEKLVDKYNDTREQEASMKVDIEQLHTMPYNETCWACKKQPWKLRKDVCDEKLNNLKADAHALQKQIKKYSGDAPDPLEYIQELKTHINNLNELESHRWQEYTTTTSMISDSLGEKELQIKWLQWRDATNAVKTWGAIEDWLAKRDEIERDMRISNDFESSLIHERILSAKLYVLQKQLRMLDVLQDNYRIEKVTQLYTRMCVIERNVHAHKCHTAYVMYEESQKLSNCIKDLEACLRKLEINKRVKIEDNVIKEQQSILSTYASSLNNRLKIIDNVFTVFSGFKQWVYANKVIPYLTKFANNIVSTLCDTRPVQLIGKMIGGNPVWFICDTNISPIEKSSGFQKFILGLAIRIALSKFGTTGMLSMQLFIDEGFTTCDSDNISKVPRFLNNMLALFPNGILLVSHMDDIKICAKLNINLNRDLLESTTMCQHGCRLFS